MFGKLRPRPSSSEPSRTENKHKVMYVLTKSANYPTVRDMMDRSGGRNIELSSHIRSQQSSDQFLSIEILILRIDIRTRMHSDRMRTPLWTILEGGG